MKNQLTKNIWRHEVKCKCGCGYDTMDFETIQVVQECCDFFATVLGTARVVCIINSGARCEAHNAAVGGAPNSQHVRGRAIDFRIRGVEPKQVYNHLHLSYPNKYGISDYGTFVHIDTRSGPPSRW
jgi:uncharacterized protein YcbK (DUF882 family)